MRFAFRLIVFPFKIWGWIKSAADEVELNEGKVEGTSEISEDWIKRQEKLAQNDLPQDTVKRGKRKEN